MKKIFIIVGLSSFHCLLSYPQLAGPLFQATLKYGSDSSSVKVVLKPSATFSGKFSNVQFTFQIPASIQPDSVTIKNNLLMGHIPTACYVRLRTNESGFNTFLFAAVPTSQPVYNFIAGTEIDALEVQLTWPYRTDGSIRLAQLPNGGSSGQLNFYIEVSGNDNTNVSGMFYGTAALNGDSYSTYSYVPLAPVSLPITMVSFDVRKSVNNAILTWSVQNESPNNSHFEIERSINGTSFSKIGELPVLTNGSSSNIYQYSDVPFSSLPNSGLLYFRLNQVDKDNKYIYRDIRLLRLEPRSGISVFPNPAKRRFYLAIPSNSSGTDKIKLSLINATGQLIDTRVITAAQATNYYFDIQKTSIVPGSYLLKMYKGNDYLDSRRVIITR